MGRLNDELLCGSPAMMTATSQLPGEEVIQKASNRPTSIFLNGWFAVLYLAAVVYNVAVKRQYSLGLPPTFMSL